VSDPNIGEPPTTSDRQPEVVAELTRSLSTIWQRHSGGKPSSASTEIATNSVKFVLADAVATIGDERVEGDDGNRSPNTPGYKNEAIAAVRRITGRKVVGFVPKRNKKTDEASDTYVLERIHVAR
jgi:hypothetical protein